MFDKYYIVTDACEICVSKYIEKESEKLKDLPMDQKKTEEIHRILHSATKACTKPCIRYPCQTFGISFHNICVEHLYEMIDAIKEKELDD